MVAVLKLPKSFSYFASVYSPKNQPVCIHAVDRSLGDAV